MESSSPRVVRGYRSKHRTKRTTPSESLWEEVEAEPKVKPTVKKPKTTIAAYFGKMRPKKVQSGAQSKSKRFSQMYLDFGQKGFTSCTCPRCGMTYCPGLEADEVAHQRFCQLSRKTPVWPGGKGSTVVICEYGAKERIVRVPDRCTVTQKQRLKEVWSIMDKALGVDGHGDIQPSKEAITLLYLQQQQIIGCLVTERIQKAFAIEEIKRGKDDQKEEISLGVSIRCLEHSVHASCGIFRIWVHTTHQRKGIATKLVDAARALHAFEKMVDKKEIAFSPPTRDGIAFAQAYVGDSRLLVYTAKDR